MLKSSIIVLAIFLILPPELYGADPGSTELSAAPVPENGLVVQVGVQNAAFLSGLTLGGKRLVHGLAMDESTRTRILPELIRSGDHPYATVSVWDSAPKLPYADRLVTVLILDRDDLGANAPPIEECQRVVEPGGTILERTKGTWKATQVARPAGLGDWTHFDGGADGNAVSSDKEATAMRGLQWIDNEREVRWAKSGPHGGEGGNIRILGRYAVIDARIYPEDKDPKFDKRYLLECRDVNNGLLIWQKARSPLVTAKRWSVAVGDGKCFTWLTEAGPLSAIDLATGKEVCTFPGSEIKPYMKEGSAKNPQNLPVKDMRGNNYWVRITENFVLANGDGGLRAWSIDGKLLWEFSRKDARLEEPVIDSKLGLVYGFITPDTLVDQWGRGPTIWGRWSTSSSITSIIALDLKTGTVRWENKELASHDTDILLFQEKQVKRTAFGQLLVTGDYVIAFNSKAISGGDIPFIASIDANTGKTVQFDPKTFVYTSPHGRIEAVDAVYCALARDGLVYVMGGFSIRSFNPKTGEMKKEFDVPWNARCQKPIATETHFLLGQTAFVDKNYCGEMFALARSGCAHSPVPGSGVIMFGPHTCACTTHFDGFLATTSHSAPEAIPDTQRLRTLTGSVAAFTAAKPPKTESLVSQSWPWFTISEPMVPAKIEKAGWTFQVDPQAHRIDASKGDTSWSFVADARLGDDFCVVEDRVVIASHDGWVHGLDLATGAPHWRHFVAPAHRLIIANGMLTSAWPTMGVADLGNGLIVSSAGTHPELDGGIRVVALKAVDGSQVWVKTLRKSTSKIPAGGGRETQIVDHSIINAAPTIENGKIVIAGGSHLGRIEIDPTEDENIINARLSAPPPKLKLRK